MNLARRMIPTRFHRAVDMEMLREAERFRFIRDNLLNLRWALITKIDPATGKPHATFERIGLVEPSNAAHLPCDPASLTERLDILMDAMKSAGEL